MSNLLYIDTSGKTALVALSRNGMVAASRSHDDAREQAALLNGMIDAVMQESATVLSDVAAICVCAGPGSYTGLRVGLSTAKGLAYALDKPLMLFSTLELLALAQRGKTAVDIILKAREGEYFYARYDREGEALSLPQHVFGDDLVRSDSEALLITDVAGLAGEQDILLGEGTALSLPHWIKAAEERFAAGSFDDLAYSEPFYLKAAYTTQSKK